MKATMNLAQLAFKLDAINAQLQSRQDDNLRAWSQTQLKPELSQAWDGLGQDLCQLCALIEDYYEQIDEFWAAAGAPGRRPVVLSDPQLLEAFRDMVLFRDTVRASGLCQDQASRVQPKVWKFLLSFPAAHGRFLTQLRALAENRV